MGRDICGPLRESMVNICSELEPRKALKPSKGMLDVPVTNCKKEIHHVVECSMNRTL